jgi:hypothetical protein
MLWLLDIADLGWSRRGRSTTFSVKAADWFWGWGVLGGEDCSACNSLIAEMTSLTIFWRAFVSLTSLPDC